MEQINALVADDELPARGELKYELASIPGVEILIHPDPEGHVDPTDLSSEDLLANRG